MFCQFTFLQFLHLKLLFGLASVFLDFEALKKELIGCFVFFCDNLYGKVPNDHAPRFRRPNVFRPEDISGKKPEKTMKMFGTIGGVDNLQYQAHTRATFVSRKDAPSTFLHALIVLTNFTPTDLEFQRKTFKKVEILFSTNHYLPSEQLPSLV